MTPQAYIEENKKRNAILDSEYDPLLGIGSPIERFEFKVSNAKSVFLPMSMKDIPIIKVVQNLHTVHKDVSPSLYNVSRTFFKSKQHKAFQFLEAGINKMRYEHDFEYWAFNNIKIKHKNTGEIVPLRLNRGQRRLLARLEKMRLEEKPIRVILLKARQWGGSTLIQFYSMWLQVIHQKNWNSCIVGDVESQAATIRGMYRLAARMYPEKDGKITLRPFERTKHIQVQETGSVIYIGSMEKPDSLRSSDFKIAHLSEVGLWKETKGKKPKDLIQSIKASIPPIANTLIAEESTAKGSGNYFHKAYLSALKGKSGYDPVFVPWQILEQCRMPLETTVENFLKSWGDSQSETYKYNTFLWSIGATLEGIKWYNWMLETEFDGDRWRMKSENPTTAEEAFQSTGHRVFPPDVVAKMREGVTDPIAVGVLTADAEVGADALKNIAFVKKERGTLKIWQFPDTTVNAVNRYVTTLDVGATSANSSFSVIRVFDKIFMPDGGVPEAVLTWEFHADQDIAAWRGAQVAKWYNNALLVVEDNPLDREKNEEGSGFLTVLDELAEHYENLYMREVFDQILKTSSFKYGFNTNKATKPMLVNFHKKAARERMYIERDEKAVDQMDTYEYREDGRVKATDGSFEDIQESGMINIWVCWNGSDPCRVITVDHKAKERREIRKRTLGEAHF